MNARKRELILASQLLNAGTVTPKEGESQDATVRRAVANVRVTDARRRKAKRTAKRAARKANR